MPKKRKLGDDIEESLRKLKNTLKIKKFEVKNADLWNFLKNDEAFDEFYVIIDKIYRRRRISSREEEMIVTFVQKYLKVAYKKHTELPWTFIVKDIPVEDFTEVFQFEGSIEKDYFLVNKDRLLDYINSILFLDNIVSGKLHQDLYMSIGAKIEGIVEKYITGGSENFETKFHKCIYRSICNVE